MPADHVAPPWAIRSTLIAVADLERSVAFYRELGPFDEIAREDAVAVLGDTSPASPILILRELGGMHHTRHGQQSLGLRSITFNVGSLGELDRIESFLRSRDLFASRRQVADGASELLREGIRTTCPWSSSATTKVARSDPTITDRSPASSIRWTPDPTTRIPERPGDAGCPGPRTFVRAEPVASPQRDLERSRNGQIAVYGPSPCDGGPRKGHGVTSDGALDVQLRTPVEMGGEGGGTNPEQLFAVGYAACFEGALGVVGRRERVDLGEVSIESEVSLITTENRGFNVAVGLDVSLPGVSDPARAVSIVAAAHEVCPYSNATRGNVEVTLKANGQSVPAATSG